VRRALFAALAAISVTACIDGDYATVAGKDYNREQVQQLKMGMSAEALRSQVGEPDPRIPRMRKRSSFSRTEGSNASQRMSRGFTNDG
jgi:hypothetical protein